MTISTLGQADSKSAAATGAGPGLGPDRSAAEPTPADPSDRPAAAAAAWVSRASLGLGGLGLASALFVLAGLLESWRVTAHGASHRISVLGEKLSYPAANVDAIVIVLLALLGLVVTVRAMTGAISELQASRRFHRGLCGEQPEGLRGATLIADPQPRAFCAGLFHPRVYLSTGAMALLDDAALGAVLAHERHHAHRHDPLRLATGRVLARALFFVPGLGDLVERQQALGELSADESAVGGLAESRSALARAMLSFSDGSSGQNSSGIDPARVDYLLGDPPSWRFPALLCLAVLSVLLLLVTVALLAGQVASGSATLAVPFLSQQPCVVVLAAIPAVVTMVVANYRRRLRLRGARGAAPSPELLR